MRFWLLHSGDVPLQDQLFAQVSLGILSGELAPGERLPSVREMARRFKIHANTVSLAYRRLEREGWLASRRGSGMYVRAAEAGQAAPQPEDVLAAMMGSLVQTAHTLGLDAAAMRAALERVLQAQPVQSFVLVEPDPALAQIVLAELTACLRAPVRGWTYPGAGRQPPSLAAGEVALVLPSKAAALRSALPAAASMQVLRVRSVPQSLAEWLPALRTALVGVASHWAPFLEFARTMLVAAGFQAEALLLRNANEPGWRQGLEQADAVVCDTYTAPLLPAGVRAIPFRFLADEAVAELRALDAGAAGAAHSSASGGDEGGPG